MGNCACQPKHSSKSTKSREPFYPRVINARIVTKGESGKGKEAKNKIESVSFEASEPIILISKNLNNAFKSFSVSSCVLPNLDPRGLLSKTCQDICFVEEGQFTVLLGEYDGHGETGTQVVEFCKEFMIDYYHTHEDIIAKTSDGPELFLTSACHDCHKGLCDSKIDVSFSGSTQVLVLIYNNQIYFANLGDSRCVLASTQDIFYVPKPVDRPKAGSSPQKIARDYKFRINTKKTPLVTGLNSIQLTRDQKPEDSEELPRLIASGARLERMSDNGRKYGPLRVWKPSANTPGLAMARSLGDSIGKEIGVICTPAINAHPIDPEHDFFVVMGSDGLWDVMENAEVMSFVATYRNRCAKTMTRRTTDSVKLNNSIIAHLLCEEARLRWVELIETEDVVIDDISCIILDFNTYKQIIPSKKSYSIHTESPVKSPGKDSSSQGKTTGKITPSPSKQDVVTPKAVKRKGIISQIKIEKST